MTKAHICVKHVAPGLDPDGIAELVFSARDPGDEIPVSHEAAFPHRLLESLFVNINAPVNAADVVPIVKECVVPDASPRDITSTTLRSVCEGWVAVSFFDIVPCSVPGVSRRCERPQCGQDDCEMHLEKLTCVVCSVVCRAMNF